MPSVPPPPIVIGGIGQPVEATRPRADPDGRRPCAEPHGAGGHPRTRSGRTWSSQFRRGGAPPAARVGLRPDPDGRADARDRRNPDGEAGQGPPAATGTSPSSSSTASTRTPSYIFRGYKEGAVDYLLKTLRPGDPAAKVSSSRSLAEERAAPPPAGHVAGGAKLIEVEKRGELRFRAADRSMPQCVWAARRDGESTTATGSGGVRRRAGGHHVLRRRPRGRAGGGTPVVPERDRLRSVGGGADPAQDAPAFVALRHHAQGASADAALRRSRCSRSSGSPEAIAFWYDRRTSSSSSADGVEERDARLLAGVLPPDPVAVVISPSRRAAHTHCGIESVSARKRSSPRFFHLDQLARPQHGLLAAEQLVLPPEIDEGPRPCPQDLRSERV